MPLGLKNRLPNFVPLLVLHGAMQHEEVGQTKRLARLRATG